MTDPRPVKREMLKDPIDISVSEPIDFISAKQMADLKAKEVTAKPMLLAWFDKNRGKHSPDVICGCGDRPSWLAYAQNREGNIAVDINNEEYVFVYRKGEF